MKKQNYIFINKALFFPKQGILAIGDLHLGYEYMLQQLGILIPETQIKELIKDLNKIFQEIKNKKLKLNKIVFIGDIKHSFGFEWQEKNYFNKVLEFVKKYVKKQDIILIKGNHDTIDYSFGNMKSYYIQDDIIFVHGHKSFPKLFDKKIKTIIMGHIHPSVILSDKQNIKREKYKCFLIGKFKSKEVIILPSFLNIAEGMTINEYDSGYEDFFSIIPKKSLMNFKVYIIGEDEVYGFGKIKDLTK